MAYLYAALQHNTSSDCRLQQPGNIQVNLGNEASARGVMSYTTVRHRSHTNGMRSAGVYIPKSQLTAYIRVLGGIFLYRRDIS